MLFKTYPVYNLIKEYGDVIITTYSNTNFQNVVTFGKNENKYVKYITYIRDISNRLIRENKDNAVLTLSVLHA
jgi:hypothetical protein